jgi:hypothetical protein
MKIPYIVTDKSVTVIVEGKALTMNQDHPNFDAVMMSLDDENATEKDIKNLFDVGSAIQDLSEGNIVVKDGVAYYKNEAIDNYCIDRAIAFMREQKPYKALLKFFDRLQANPSKRAVSELYRFLEHKNMPITPDGHFLAYKGVDLNYMDKYTHKFNNNVGQVLEMIRNKVDDDANVGCSAGFHAGSYEYADSYCGQNGRLMLVKIDPADVVSVPHDCECQKLRTCRYEVVSELEERTPLEECYNEQYGDSDCDEDNEVECVECGIFGDPEDFTDDGCERLTCPNCENDEGYVDSPENHSNKPTDYEDVIFDAVKKAYDKGYQVTMSKFHNKRDNSGKFCK